MTVYLHKKPQSILEQVKWLTVIWIILVVSKDKETVLTNSDATSTNLKLLSERNVTFQFQNEKNRSSGCGVMAEKVVFSNFFLHIP